MNDFSKCLVSENLVADLKREHNVVQSDGSVVVNKTYADVVKGSFIETYVPSADDLSRFVKMNKYAKILNGCVIEENPKDFEEFKMPAKETLYFDN